jgi:hypothetical protein
MEVWEGAFVWGMLRKDEQGGTAAPGCSGAGEGACSTSFMATQLQMDIFC